MVGEGGVKQKGKGSERKRPVFVHLEGCEILGRDSGAPGESELQKRRKRILPHN